MFISAIARLRRLPKQTRNTLALAISSGFTGVVVLLWFVSVSNNWRNQQAVVHVGVVDGYDGAFTVFMDGVRSRVTEWGNVLPQSSGPEEDVSSVLQTERFVVPESQATTNATAQSSEDLVETLPEMTEHLDAAAVPANEASQYTVPIRIATTSRHTDTQRLEGL